ncbi:ABC transporter permease [Paenibacillus piri]|uniref:Sugar ABC transporter permease n=1 Tax=Paenibacillus piri TaxID=2547395 RepID=A0A4R5K9Y1_9BACL|nr:sugar ABC transporter permease [Paenibacillus piri]
MVVQGSRSVADLDADTGALPRQQPVAQSWNWKRNWPLHAMLLPGFMLVLLFSYGPMFGLVMAFQEFKPWLGFTGSSWVGLDHFKDMFMQGETRQIIWNTLIISILKIVAQLTASVLFALLLNEFRISWLKRSVQTLVYLPHFMSWVILGGILLDMLSVKGLANQLLAAFGVEPIFFLGSGSWFRFTVVLSAVWKEFGFGAIVFLAALAGINPSLYEAAAIDGANRWKQVLHVTLPSLTPMIMVVGTLSLGDILNAGFDQIFNLYSPLVYKEGDIIDTYVYRVALLSGSFSFGTAFGMLKSVVGLVLVVIGYRLAFKFANYRIF